MGRIRYVAAMSRDPDALAGFYTRFLDMKELGRSADGDVSLTDSLYNLTLFRKREGLGELHTRRGLHHIGLQVEDLGEVRARYQKFNPRGLMVREPEDIHHGAIPMRSSVSGTRRTTPWTCPRPRAGRWISISGNVPPEKRFYGD